MGITNHDKCRTSCMMNKTDSAKEPDYIQFSAENMLFDIEQEETNKLLANALMENKRQQIPGETKAQRKPEKEQNN